MANEIAIPWLIGATIIANVFKPDGTERELNISLTENPIGGLYLGDCATIETGDIILVYENGMVLGSAEYELTKVLTAWCAGDWRLKSGETKVFELLDADDKNTVILEMRLSKITPYRTITKKI